MSVKNLIGVVIFVILFISSRSKVFGYDVWHDPPRIWTNTLDGGDSNKQLFDAYAVTHVIWGMATYLISRYYLDMSTDHIVTYGTIAHCAFEAIENTGPVIRMFRQDPLNRNYEGDSLANMLGDSIAYYGGIRLADQMGLYWTMISIAILEFMLYRSIGHNTMSLIAFSITEAEKSIA